MPHLWIYTVTIAARDPRALATFWMAILGYVVGPNHSDSVQLNDPAGSGPSLLFAPTDHEGFGRDKFHLDLRPHDQGQQIEKALSLGARRLPTLRDDTWQRMADPEGNRFCILQSDTDAEVFAHTHGPGIPSM
jgi:hypothetical protein